MPLMRLDVIIVNFDVIEINLVYRLPFLSIPPLNIHQSMTIESWVENLALQPNIHPLRTVG